MIRGLALRSLCTLAGVLTRARVAFRLSNRLSRNQTSYLEFGPWPLCFIEIAMARPHGHSATSEAATIYAVLFTWLLRLPELGEHGGVPPFLRVFGYRAVFAWQVVANNMSHNQNPGK